MATTPAFAVTPRIGAGISPSADTSSTNRTAPSSTTTILTGASTGTKIERVILQGVGTTVVGIYGIFLYDSTTYHLFDEFGVNAVTLANTTSCWRAERQYYDLILPSTSWSLRLATFTTSNNAVAKCIALGADL